LVAAAPSLSNSEAISGPVFSAERTATPAPTASELIAAGLVRKPARRIHIALVAMAGLGVGLVSGLALLLPRASSSQAPTAEHANVPPPQPAEPVPPPAVTPAPPAAVTASPAPPPAVVATEAAANEGSVIPWDDLAQVKGTSCEELAAPSLQASKGVALQNALKEAPRAMMRGDAQAALQAFCVATQLGARTPPILSGLSQTQLMLSQLDTALQTADQLVQLDPTAAAALDLRGDVLIRLGRVEEAKSSWVAAAGASRTSDLLIRNLLRSNKSAAEAALRAGDLSRADRMLRRAIALAPTDATPCLQLATVLAKTGQQAAAQRWKSYAESLAR
jgi:Flp pilus assembly protein TadD